MDIFKSNFENRTDRIFATSGVSDAEPDVALVVDRGRVGELVSLEVNQSRRLAHAVLEFPHDLTIDRASEIELIVFVSF